MNLLRTASPLLLPLAGCASNYDFAQARLPGGGYDVPKLIADLKASGEGRLHDGAWFPLIRLERTEFKPSAAAYPEGYILSATSAYGPLFFTAHNDDRIVDGKGELVEAIDASWFGWGLLHHSREHDIATTHGLRKHVHWRALLLFGRTDLKYGAGDRKPAGAPAGGPSQP